MRKYIIQDYEGNYWCEEGKMGYWSSFPEAFDRAKRMNIFRVQFFRYCMWIDNILTVKIMIDEVNKSEVVK